MSPPEIVGRTGHMENGEYVEDTVTVRVEADGGWQVLANDVNAEEAEKRGKEAIGKAKGELLEQVRHRVAMGALTNDEAQQVLDEAGI